MGPPEKPAKSYLDWLRKDNLQLSAKELRKVAYVTT
jgi:hypothetical protein